MLKRSVRIARSWRCWGGGIAGAAFLSQVIAAAGHAPTHGPSASATPPDPVSIPVRGVEPESGPGWPIGQPVGIRVENGRAVFRAPAHSRGAQILVIVSMLARGGGLFPVTLRVQPTARSEPPLLETVPAAPLPPRPLAVKLPPVPEPAAEHPPLDRTFHLLIRDGDAASSRNYAAVSGRLRAVGERVQVYVAREDLGRVGDDVLRDLVETFDHHVFPTAAQTLGQARDVDGDGRFTIFLSGWLARMGQGTQAVDGFIRAADLDPAYAPPFGNRCDMMYLNADLKSGPHLRTVIAHEYTHAVTFSQKALTSNRGTPPRNRREEEGWLDEALAHLAEDLHGFSRSNLDYRVSAFLSKPWVYRLVVDDYYAENLFRSHGNRGSTYLFLRWCADQYGPSLLPRLINSNRCGSDNLEAATQCSFAGLYRRWSIALAAAAVGSDGSPPALDSEGFRSIDIQDRGGGHCLAGPRIDRIRPENGEVHWNSAGTSSRYFVVEGVDADSVEVVATGPREAELQVTAIVLPNDLPSIDWDLQPSYDAAGDLNLAISATVHGKRTVELVALAWEPLAPSAVPKSSMVPSGRLDESEIATYFGSTTLQPGKERRSAHVRLAGVRRECGPYVLKLIGRDSSGQTVTAWADVGAAPGGFPRGSKRNAIDALAADAPPGAGDLE